MTRTRTRRRARYVDAPQRWHRALTELGATVDVVHPSADLVGYRLVVVPTLLPVLGRAGARAGGRGGARRARARHLLLGIVDEHDHVRLGGYPGAFRALLGVRSEEFAPLRTAVSLDDGCRRRPVERGADRHRRGGDRVARGRHARGHRQQAAPGTSPRGWTSRHRGARRRVADSCGCAARARVRARASRSSGEGSTCSCSTAATPAEVPVVGTDLLTGAAHNDKVTVGSGSVAVVRGG